MRRSATRLGALGALCATLAPVAYGCSDGQNRERPSRDAGVKDSGSGAGGGGRAGSGGGSDGGSPSGGSGGRATGTGGSGTVPADAGPIDAPQPRSPYIVVDQFGYRPDAEKIAVLRDPQVGFDASESFTPGAAYAVVDAHSGDRVFEGAPVVWNGGNTDDASGDKAWWFDFSGVTAPGDYFVLDESANVRSDVFRVSTDVYRDVLAQSVRMLFYQRDGFAKTAEYAGAGWADGAAHMGPLQDTHCRLYSAKDDASTEKDLHGGWFDAGDYNKYTNWAAGYVIQFLRAYSEAPAAFRDDYGIPESGNGVPDVLDETKWELDWLVRMQNDDGSVLSIVGEAGDSPPSAATGQSLYGSANTSATLTSAAAYAYGARVYRAVDAAKFGAYADDLERRAKKAWTWAAANPNVTFQNNDGASGTEGLGAGRQEVDDRGRLMKKLAAAVYLYELTGDTAYRDFFDQNYGQTQLLAGGYLDLFDLEANDVLLEYTKAQGATASVVDRVRSAYAAGMDSDHNLGSVRGNVDPYLAALYVYTWGSNQNKAQQGLLFSDLVTYGIDASSSADALRGAERYVHYVHGVNPFGMVYLSNMAAYGAAKSVTRFFHTWFSHGSARWDAVGESTYGPPPGYLVGGPNPSYSWDGCCPSGCSGVPCGDAPPAPPAGQPPAKSYEDFNDSWPLDSWSVTEPDVGYQALYIRLLSKFVE